MQYILRQIQSGITAPIKMLQQLFGFQEKQQLYFYARCAGKIMDSNGCTFLFSEYNTKYMYFQWTRKSCCSKINLTDQFDYASAKNGYKWDLKWLSGCFNG